MWTAGAFVAIAVLQQGLAIANVWFGYGEWGSREIQNSKFKTHHSITWSPHHPHLPHHPTHQNHTLHHPAGQTLGLLGRTGSGKSTLARLLLRLYDIQQGQVRLGGVDISQVSRVELPHHVGFVTQDVQLFQTSVRNNLTFFNRHIGDRAILQTLDELGLIPWLEALSAGLDTELGADSGGLSAGQAQLLAFARVFLKDPWLVVLDEASSRLDPLTEQLIERAVERLLVNRTGLIIAHRLKTVERADQILILEQGQVVEYGDRATLLANPNSQFSRLLAVGAMPDHP